MPKDLKLKKPKIYRILDANINRAKEGLRVCEEVARFILNSRALTEDLKKIRHSISSIANKFFSQEELLAQRDSRGDIGLKLYAGELKRKNTRELFLANMQRAKESLRVLEEFGKLLDQACAVSFKRIRYRLYEAEKRAIKKLPALRDY